MKVVTEREKEVIKRINNSIKIIEDNKFTLYFFVIDSKNIPNSTLSYIYEMAKTLHDDGFNVKMLYQLENEYTEGELYSIKKNEEEIDYSRVFVGVKEWMGEEYAAIPHMNIAVEEWSVQPSDFLFIPEALSGLMFETYKHKLPCKRDVIMNDYNHVTEFIPLGVEWKNYGIYDVITTTNKQAELIKTVFPYVEVSVIPPVIPDMFRKPLRPKKLVVNIIAKEQEDINRIIKPFYWKYPMYKFITFRELKNLPMEEYARRLSDGAITIWVDKNTSFGRSALEAMRCDNIVIGKIPEDIPEWMIDVEGNLKNNGIWTYNIKEIPDLLAKTIGSWMRNEIPDTILEEMNETNKKYIQSEWEQNVIDTFDKLIEKQIEMYKEIKNNIIKGTENK